MKNKYILKNTRRGSVIRKVYIETPTNQEVSITKGNLRETIQKEVFDINDSVADNAKMISLMMTTMSRMWEIIPMEQKDLLETEEVAMIDATFTLFGNVVTSADVQFASEGMGLVEKLLNRQSEIGNIIIKG